MSLLKFCWTTKLHVYHHKIAQARRGGERQIRAIPIATGKAALLLFCSTSSARGVEFFSFFEGFSRVGNWSILTHFLMMDSGVAARYSCNLYNTFCFHIWRPNIHKIMWMSYMEAPLYKRFDRDQAHLWFLRHVIHWVKRVPGFRLQSISLSDYNLQPCPGHFSLMSNLEDMGDREHAQPERPQTPKPLCGGEIT